MVPVVSDEMWERGIRVLSGNDFFAQSVAEGTIGYMLTALRERGIRVAVVSNKFDAATKQLCKKYFGDLVEVAIGERAGVRKKPAPDTVHEALRELGVTAEGAVYIGDSDVDIRTAENCGMPCISVTWGLRDKDFLIENGAKALVDSPESLLGVIIV